MPDLIGSADSLPPRLMQSTALSPTPRLRLLPKCMLATVHVFELWPSDRYRLSLRYIATENATLGKSAANEDVVKATFESLVPDTQVVQRVTFVSDDPALLGKW